MTPRSGGSGLVPGGPAGQVDGGVVVPVVAYTTGRAGPVGLAPAEARPGSVTAFPSMRSWPGWRSRNDWRGALRLLRFGNSTGRPFRSPRRDSEEFFNAVARSTAAHSATSHGWAG